MSVPESKVSWIHCSVTRFSCNCVILAAAASRVWTETSVETEMINCAKCTTTLLLLRLPLVKMLKSKQWCTKSICETSEIKKMLWVSSCWASYIHWGKVHNFVIICISLLIHSGYATFCQDSHMSMFFITSDFLPPSHWEKQFGYLYLFFDVQKWNGLDFQKFHIKAVRALTSPLVSPLPLPFLSPGFFLCWRKNARKRTPPLRNKVAIYNLLRRWRAGPICNVSLIVRNMEVKLASLTYLGLSKV